MYAMSTLSRSALAFVALCLAGTASADSFLPPAIAALHAKAENGNAIAQYNLGLAYATCRGVAVDPAEAFVWLTLASEQGSTGKDLGVLVSNMSPESLAEGRRRLAAERNTIGIPAPAAKQAPTPPAAVETPAPAKEQPAAPEAPA